MPAARRKTRSSSTAAASKEQARDYVDVADAYARDVVAGKIVAGKWVKLACKRHLDDLVRAKLGADWGYHYDRWHGNDVCGFIEKLPHTEGVWETPTIKLEPPQIFILAVVFGWRRNRDNGRRFSTAYIEMARKAAKSTLTGGVVLYCTACEGEVGPQVVIGATTRDQANKVFLPAKRMVQWTPALQEAFGFHTWANSITCDSTGGFIQPINSIGKTQDGHNPHLSVLDELHAHKNRALFDVIKSARGARKNRLMWIITTAGFNLYGVCYEQRTYLTKVLEGVFEADHFFGIIFSLDEEDDCFDEKVWAKANPMIGITPTWESMREDAADARASPDSLANFKTKNCNIWLGAAAGWLSPEAWKACANDTLDWKDFEGLTCWIGADLADKDDICALVLIAFDKTGRLLVKPKFYLPELVLKNPLHAQGSGPAPYVSWRDQKLLTITPGDWVDFDEVRRQIDEWRERFYVAGAVFDQFAGAQQMISDLNKNGDPDKPFAWSLPKKAINVTDPARELESRVKGGPARLWHDGNPCLAWMASNAVVSRRTDGTILPKKESEMSPNKIDGIDAIVNALKPFTMVETTRRSVYDILAEQDNEAGEEEATAAPSGEIDYAILNDPDHPRFEEMKRLFEQKQAQEDEDL